MQSLSLHFCGTGCLRIFNIANFFFVIHLHMTQEKIQMPNNKKLKCNLNFKSMQIQTKENISQFVCEFWTREERDICTCTFCPFAFYSIHSLKWNEIKFVLVSNHTYFMIISVKWFCIFIMLLQPKWKGGMKKWFIITINKY